jgi:anti-sigma factor (TIGR02949 family)
MSGYFDRLRHDCGCRWARDHMSDYLDGELPPSPRSRMERHVEECAKCRGVLGTLSRMLSALRRVPPPAGGADARRIAASVRRRLGEPPPPE